MQLSPLTNSQIYHHFQGGHPVPIKQALHILSSSQPPGTSNLLSSSINLPILDVSDRRDHTLYNLLGLLSLSIMFFEGYPCFSI